MFRLIHACIEPSEACAEPAHFGRSLPAGAWGAFSFVLDALLLLTAG